MIPDGVHCGSRLSCIARIVRSSHGERALDLWILIIACALVDVQFATHDWLGSGRDFEEELVKLSIERNSAESKQ